MGEVKTFLRIIGIIYARLVAGMLAFVIASFEQMPPTPDAAPASGGGASRYDMNAVREGYDAGKETGEKQWSFGMDMPTSAAMSNLARGSHWQHGSKGDPVAWALSFRQGFSEGF